MKSTISIWDTCKQAALVFLTTVLLTFSLAALSSGCGCTTVIPKTVTSSQPSWDGTNQNSGFIRFEGNSGVITSNARVRYNGLIEIYGKKFVPPITTDFGVWPDKDGNYIITPQALTKFIEMNRWRKSGILP